MITYRPLGPGTVVSWGLYWLQTSRMVNWYVQQLLYSTLLYCML